MSDWDGPKREVTPSEVAYVNRVAEIVGFPADYVGGVIPAECEVSWLITWLKQRHFSRLQNIPVRRREDDDAIVTAILHVGFLTLEETPEMLARLPEETKKKTRGPRRPSDSAVVLRPVDRVAMRVAGWE